MTLHQLNRVIERVTGDDLVVRVENPFARHTKGDVCRAARDAGCHSGCWSRP